MTTLREKMKQEMTLRGLSSGTQENYLRPVIKLHDYYKRNPARLNEDEIKRIYKFINYDTVEKYSFTFSKKCNEIFLNVARMHSSENESVKSSIILSSAEKIFSEKSSCSDSECPQLFYKIENKKVNTKIMNLIQIIYRLKISNNFNMRNLDYLNKFLFSEKIYKNVRDYLLNYEKKEIQIVFK